MGGGWTGTPPGGSSAGPPAAGIIKNVTPYTLRHAFTTAALDAGVRLRDVQEAASHADPRTTMRYGDSRVLHLPGEKPQVTRSRRCWNSVPYLRAAAF